MDWQEGIQTLTPEWWMCLCQTPPRSCVSASFWRPPRGSGDRGPGRPSLAVHASPCLSVWSWRWGHLGLSLQLQSPAPGEDWAGSSWCPVLHTGSYSCCQPCWAQQAAHTHTHKHTHTHTHTQTTTDTGIVVNPYKKEARTQLQLSTTTTQFCDVKNVIYTVHLLLLTFISSL